MPLTPRPIEAVLLDLDDTLYPERSYVESGFVAVAGWLAEQTGEDAGAIAAAMLDTLAREGRGRVFDGALASRGLDPALAPLLVHLYRTHTPTPALFPDVALALIEWRRRGLKLGVVTDGASAMQTRKAAALGLSALVDVVVCTDDLGPGRAKPAPDGYAVALASLGVSPAAAVYVGDDPAKDFVGARALGMATVRLERNLAHPLRRPPPWPEGGEADAVFPDLGALYSILSSRKARSAYPGPPHPPTSQPVAVPARRCAAAGMTGQE